MFALVQVALLGLHNISFLLQRNIIIRLLGVTINDQSYQPFKTVPQEEEYPQHFRLLMSVNILVLKVFFVNLTAFADEDDGP